MLLDLLAHVLHTGSYLVDHVSCAVYDLLSHVFRPVCHVLGRATTGEHQARHDQGCYHADSEFSSRLHIPGSGAVGEVDA